MHACGQPRRSLSVAFDASMRTQRASVPECTKGLWDETSAFPSHSIHVSLEKERRLRQLGGFIVFVKPFLSRTAIAPKCRVYIL